MPAQSSDSPSMRTQFLFRTLSTIAVAGVVLATAGALYFAFDRLRYAETEALFFVLPIIVSTVTLVIGLGIALYFVLRSYSGRDALSPRIRLALSNRAFVGVAVAIAILLWCYASWSAAFIIERGLQGFPSPSAFRFDLVLGVPLGVLLPLAAGWIFYAAMHLSPPAGDSDAHDAMRLLGNVLTTFGILWIAFASACTLTAGFSGRPVFSGIFTRELLFLLYGALVVAYGAVFLVVGWRLRMVRRA